MQIRLQLSCKRVLRLILTEEKRQLATDLREEQCKTLALESKLLGLELQCLRDQTKGIAAFQKIAKLEELLREKIEAHMQTGDVLYSIAKHWDYGFEAFRKQVQACILVGTSP
ncbi:hypothetical protein U1Q18_047190 [Sarracenia purpurea var. burkii]